MIESSDQSINITKPLSFTWKDLIKLTTNAALSSSSKPRVSGMNMMGLGMPQQNSNIQQIPQQNMFPKQQEQSSDIMQIIALASKLFGFGG